MPEPSNRLSAEARYQRDPQFHLMVDTLLALVRQGDYTPTELREAVVLACTIHEYETVRWYGRRS